MSTGDDLVDTCVIRCRRRIWRYKPSCDRNIGFWSQLIQLMTFRTHSMVAKSSESRRSYLSARPRILVVPPIVYAPDHPKGLEYYPDRAARDRMLLLARKSQTSWNMQTWRTWQHHSSEVGLEGCHQHRLSSFEQYTLTGPKSRRKYALQHVRIPLTKARPSNAVGLEEMSDRAPLWPARRGVMQVKRGQEMTSKPSKEIEGSCSSVSQLWRTLI